MIIHDVYEKIGYCLYLIRDIKEKWRPQFNENQACSQDVQSWLQSY
jgi:hypothetical protein